MMIALSMGQYLALAQKVSAKEGTMQKVCTCKQVAEPEGGDPCWSGEPDYRASGQYPEKRLLYRKTGLIPSITIKIGK